MRPRKGQRPLERHCRGGQGWKAARGTVKPSSSGQGDRPSEGEAPALRHNDKSPGLGLTGTRLLQADNIPSDFTAPLLSHPSGRGPPGTWYLRPGLEHCLPEGQGHQGWEESKLGWGHRGPAGPGQPPPGDQPPLGLACRRLACRRKYPPVSFKGLMKV